MINNFKEAKEYCGFAKGLSETDNRIPKFLEQYNNQGWDDTYTWSLFTSLAIFLLPKLKRFKEITISHPYFLTEDEWDKGLDKMIVWLELITRDEGAMLFTDEEKELVHIGRLSFTEYFYDLWW